MATGTKAARRQQTRQQRRAVSPAQQTAAAQALLAQLQTLPAFMPARHIALYLVHDGEIDPCEVMRWCWQHDRHCYVPLVMAGERQLLFGEVLAQSEYQPNRFGINEPIVTPAQTRPATAMDFVLVPLVAFDAVGNRLGMGGGFYDTTFAFMHTRPSTATPTLVGVAYELQKVPHIACEPWDLPLPTVVTEQHIYHANHDPNPARARPSWALGE